MQRGLRGSGRLLAPQRLDELQPRARPPRDAGAASRAMPAAWGAPGSRRGHPRQPSADQAARTPPRGLSHGVSPTLAARYGRVSRLRDRRDEAGSTRSSPREDGPKGAPDGAPSGQAAIVPRLSGRGAAGAAGGVPLPRLPARGHRRRRARTSSRSSTPRTGRIVHETPMPNVGDELHHFGWNRCSSACHGPDRSHLIVPGFRSSRIHVVNVADDPRRPRDREGHRAARSSSRRPATRARTPSTACRATTSWSACSATATATAPAASPSSTRGPSRSRAAGRTAAAGRR